MSRLTLTQGREQLVESVAEINDDLLNRYLEGEEISSDELKQVLREGVVSGQLFPVVCVSGGQCAGIQPLLDAIVDYLPSPDETPAVTRQKPQESRR